MIITGGSRGIGAATARLAAKSGYDVCINYLRDAAAAERVVAEVRSGERRAYAMQADVGCESDVVRLFEATDRELGRVTVLVNNAATVGEGRRRVEAMRAEAVNALLAANVTGSIVCAREAIRRMSSRHGGLGGVIVNVSSASSRFGAPKGTVLSILSPSTITGKAFTAPSAIRSDYRRARSASNRRRAWNIWKTSCASSLSAPSAPTTVCASKG